MKTKKSLTTIIFILTTTSIFATSYTWTGAGDSVYTKVNNWNPSTGYPGSADTAIIVSQANIPTLAGNHSVARLVMTSGTLNLNGYEFTIQGTSVFSAGTISSGNLIIRGTAAIFTGTTINAALDAYCDRIELNGGIFNESCIFTTTGLDDSPGSGGCVFNDVVTIVHNGTNRKAFRMGMTNGDEFNGTLSITNSSNGRLSLSEADTTFFNGSLELNNNGTGTIHFSYSGGLSELASGNTISVGATGFATNELILYNFRQSGATTQTIILTGTAKIYLNNCEFNGAVTITASNLFCGNSIFNSDCELIRTGSNTNYWYGNNIFNGTATITNQGAGGSGDELRLAATSSNFYNGNAVFQSTGKPIQVVWEGGSEFKGDISQNDSSITFKKGITTLNGSVAQGLEGPGYFDFNDLIIDKPSEHVTANIPIEIIGLLGLTSGNLVTDSVNLLTMKAGSEVQHASNSSFVAGPVKKVGDTAFEFPVGKNQGFRCIEISAPQNIADAFIVEYFDFGQQLGFQMDSTINNISNCNYWNIIQTVGNNSCDITFSYASSNCESVLELPIHVANWHNSKWNDLGLAQLLGNEYQIDSISNFGSFLASNYLKNGQSCEMPIIIAIDSIYNASDHLFEAFTAWYYFTPDSSENLLTINNHIDSTSTYSLLKDIELYTGSFCDSLSIVQFWNLDTIAGNVPFSEVINLIPENNYYLKLTRYNHYDPCSQCSADSFQVNVCIQQLLHSGISLFPACSNLITNPGFNTGACGASNCNNTSANNIINECCSGWHAGWGSPQAAGNPGSQYLSMWCNNGNPPLGEGAYQNLTTPIYKNRTYVMNYDYRSTTTQAQMLRIYLRSSTIIPGGIPIANPSCGGGDNLPWNVQSFPGVQLDVITTGLPLNWAHRSRCFNYSSLGGGTNSLDQIVIYPEHYQAGTGWVDVDNFLIQELRYDFPNQTLCYNESITITPYCSINGVTYSWDLSDPGLSCYNCESPTITNTNSTGTTQTIDYTVTLNFTPSVGTSCSETFDISITFLPPPDISISTTETCINNDICFNFIPCSGQTAIWNFGDGTIVNQTTGTICHQYATPGAYLVTLTVNGPGANTYTTSDYIQIYPNCCSFGFPFSHSDIIVNPTGTTETWNSSSAYVAVNGTITVKTGKTLEIIGHYMRFGPKGKIVVEPGATLDINGSTLTGIYFWDPPCVNMWHGIEVHGIPTINHNVSNQWQHGRLVISNSSIIKDAHNAVVVGKPMGAGFDLNFSGGIVDAQSSTFSNNGNNFRFAPYTFTNVSRILDCDFLTPNNLGYLLWDPGYTSGNSYTYPNQYNQFYGPANVIGRSANGIKTLGVKNIILQDNTFNNIQTCIYNTDSRLRIYENIFENSYYGIYISNTSTSLFNGNTISGNNFSDVNRQINIVGGKYDYIGPFGSIAKNLFNPSSGDYSDNQFGIYLLGTSSFSVLDNEFYNLSYGIGILNSSTSGGYIGYRDEGNIFEDCKYSIRGMNNNPALRIHCNQYLSNNSQNYSKSWAIGGIIGDQGMPSSNDPKLSAGNRFFNTFLRDISSSLTLNYYRHDLTGDPNVDFNPQVQTLEFQNGVPFSSTNPDLPCAAEPYDDGQRIAAIDSLGAIIDSLELIINDINEHLSGEETSEIIEAINSYSSQSELMDLLRESSPLTDEIISYLNSNDHCLSSDSLKTIFIINSSLSDDIYWDIMTANELLDSVQKSVITIDQLDYGSNYSLSAVSRKINYLHNFREQLCSQQILAFINDSNETDALEFLNNSNSNEDAQTVFSSYLLYNQLDSAQIVLGYIDSNADTDPDWLTVQEILLNLATNNKTVFEIDSMDHTILVGIAQKEQGSLATANARAILRLVFNEEYEDSWDYNNREMNPNQNMIKNSFDDQFVVYPIPANEKLTVSFYKSTIRFEKFEILDVIGNVIGTGEINSKQLCVEIKTKTLANGIYTLKLFSEYSIGIRKFMIIH